MPSAFTELRVSWLVVLATLLVSDLASSPGFPGGLICQFKEHRTKGWVAQAWIAKFLPKFLRARKAIGFGESVVLLV